MSGFPLPLLNGGFLPSLGGFLYHHWIEPVPFPLLIEFLLPSLDGFALPSLDGLSLSLLDGLLLPSLDGFSIPSLDGVFFFIIGWSFTLFFGLIVRIFEGGEAVPAAWIVRSTLTPDLQACAITNPRPYCYAIR